MTPTNRKPHVPRKLHTVKTCPCIPCQKRRERIAKVNKALHSRWMHAIVFCSVAVGLTIMTQSKWFESIPLGAFMARGVELLGEIVCDRMLPDQLLRG